MASLSRKARLQRCSWQLLEDLAFCVQRHQRLAELAAQVLVERQEAVQPRPIDPELEALLPYRGLALQPAGLLRGACRLAGRGAGGAGERRRL